MVYRVIYEIDESRMAVRVLTIRHAAMDEFTKGDRMAKWDWQKTGPKTWANCCGIGRHGSR